MYNLATNTPIDLAQTKSSSHLVPVAYACCVSIVEQANSGTRECLQIKKVWLYTHFTYRKN